ncbi:sensor histidine kinase [Oryzihumus sp.]|uniref:sensor histidine kinase n=1 Tax=Oryzihumus sp. TaxID=1968903 RepID=UPI002EDBA2A0
MTTLRGWGTADATGRPRRIGVLFSAIWLVFLAEPLRAGWQERDTWQGWAGIAATVLFAATYVMAFAWVRGRQLRLGAARQPQAAAVLALLVALAAVMCLAVGEPGLATTVYLTVTAVMLLPSRVALAAVLALAGVTLLLGVVVPGWQGQPSLLLSIFLAAFAMWGVSQLIRRNIDLSLAREENARLAVEEERNRVARDLHDILGHSLTVITVKAELAGRLMEVDPDRARAEVADLERLSRDALVDVRRAVEGYRELTLPGELARARAALGAAEIDADLPTSTDMVPGDLRELFAWGVREGVTNVIRHSAATRCTVRLTPDSVEVLDNGRGPRDAELMERSGNGLRGLCERAAAVGATLMTRTVEPQGFSMQIIAAAAA